MLVAISQHTPANRVVTGSRYRGRHRSRERRTGRRIAVLALALVVGSGGVAGAGVLASQTSRPATSVQNFLQALVDGRVADAVAASGGEPAGVSLALLSDEIYRSASNRITDFRITSTSVDGDRATVSAALTQGSERLEHDFSLSKAGTDFGVVDRWILDALVMGTVSIVAQLPTGQPLVVNGVDIPAVTLDEQTPAVFAALPGSYTVTVPATNDSFTVNPVTAAVTGLTTESGANPDPVPVVAELTEAGKSRALESVNQFLDACVGQPTLGPDGCPFAATTVVGETYSDVIWDVVVEPGFTIGQWINGGWRVETTSPGSIEVTANVTDQTSGAVRQATASFSGVGFVGVVTLAENGEPEFEPAPIAG